MSFVYIGCVTCMHIIGKVRLRRRSRARVFRPRSVFFPRPTLAFLSHVAPLSFTRTDPRQVRGHLPGCVDGTLPPSHAPWLCVACGEQGGGLPSFLPSHRRAPCPETAWAGPVSLVPPHLGSAPSRTPAWEARTNYELPGYERVRARAPTHPPHPPPPPKKRVQKWVLFRFKGVFLLERGLCFHNTHAFPTDRPPRTHTARPHNTLTLPSQLFIMQQQHRASRQGPRQSAPAAGPPAYICCPPPGPG